jgi:AcrR family transcriptional regulator
MAILARRRGRPKVAELQARREEEILDAAASLFAAHGYAATDIDSVAEALNLAKGTIYHYFTSKRELFLAAVNRGMRRLYETIEAKTIAIADPLQRIEQAIYTFLAYFEAHPELLQLFLQECSQFPATDKPAYFRHHDAKVGPWRELYLNLVAAGRVRDIPAAEDHAVVSDLLYGTILANHLTQRRISYQVQARTIVDVVFNGLLTDTERERRAAKPTTQEEVEP